MQPIKPGYKTTEFWITTLATLGALGAALQGMLPPKYAALVGAISAGCYAISRGLAKV